MASYEFDIHTHSIASGHGTCATMTDMAKAANAAGLKMLGISFLIQNIYLCAVKHSNTETL